MADLISCKFSVEHVPEVMMLAKRVGVFGDEDLNILQEVLQELAYPLLGDDYRACEYIAEGGAIRGVAIYCQDDIAQDVWQLDWLFVDPAIQHRGVATQLMERVEKDVLFANARMLYLETSDAPVYEPARKFYRHFGFVPISVFSDYYKRGEAKITMRKVFRDE